jgi:hypothetical protein
MNHECVSAAAVATRRGLRADPPRPGCPRCPQLTGELLAQCVITEEVCDDVAALVAACEAAAEPLEADALLGWGPAARALDLVRAALARVRPAGTAGAA